MLPPASSKYFGVLANLPGWGSGSRGESHFLDERCGDDDGSEKAWVSGKAVDVSKANKRRGIRENGAIVVRWR